LYNCGHFIDLKNDLNDTTNTTELQFMIGDGTMDSTFGEIREVLNDRKIANMASNSKKIFVL